MPRITRYRSLIIVTLAVATLTLTACQQPNKKHVTLKEEQYNRWNMTRVGVLNQLAAQQYAAGEYDKAKETLGQAYALKTDSAPTYILGGKIEIEKGSLELAADYLKAALRIDPQNPEPYYLLGVVYQRWQKADVAHDYYASAFAKKPTDPLYLLAVTEMKITLGQIDEAQTLLEEKTVYFEQTAAVRVALARIHILKNDYPTASRYYREATILVPEDLAIRQSYAESLYFANKFTDALPLLEELKKQPDVTNRDNLLVMLGQTYHALHRPVDARNILQEVCRNSPNNAAAFINLGKVCVQSNDLSLATSAARHVLKIEPDSVQAAMLLALIQQKQKKWTDAQVTLQKAIKLAPSDPTLLCMMGINQQHLGDRVEAINTFKKALAANPQDAWAKELLASAQPVAATSSDLTPPTP